MAAWISRTFFLAKTCMWLDTYIVQVYRGKKNNKQKKNKKQIKFKMSIFFLKEKKKNFSEGRKLFASSVSSAVKVTTFPARYQALSTEA